MIVAGSNLLLYAYDQESPFHVRAAEWWQGCLAGTEAVGLAAVVAFGYLRISTNRHAFVKPLPAEAAARAVRQWLRRPVVQWVAGGTAQVELALRLIEACGVAGDRVTDA